MKDRNSEMEKALDQFTDMPGAGAASPQPAAKVEDSFASAYAKLKQAVIRPAFENVGGLLTTRGHEIHISEEPEGKIAIHIVPAGTNKSIHPNDWFPTFALFAAPFTKSIGVHVRNARPNSEGSSRGEYKLAQVDKAMVEKELMKFVGEIANWK